MFALASIRCCCATVFTVLAKRSGVLLDGTGGGGLESGLGGSSDVSLAGDVAYRRGIELDRVGESPFVERVVMLGRDARGPLIYEIRSLLGRAGSAGGDVTVVDMERRFLLRTAEGLMGCSGLNTSGDGDAPALCIEDLNQEHKT